MSAINTEYVFAKNWIVKKNVQPYMQCIETDAYSYDALMGEKIEETEKAVKVEFDRTMWGGGTYFMWIPKSCLISEENLDGLKVVDVMGKDYFA